MGNNNKRYIFTALALAASGLMVVSFQNCSKIAVDSKVDGASTGLGTPDDPSMVLKDFSQKAYVKANNNKLDVILVIDNSGSMDNDAKKLASRLNGFIDNLASSDIDWQACITTTDVGATAGKSLAWKTSAGDKMVLKKGDANLSMVFADTIASFFVKSGGGDERGIYALKRNLEYINSSGCYREGSLVSTIVLSDEDERSVGGDKSIYQSYVDSGVFTQKDLDSQYKPLESVDQPENYIADFRKLLPKNNLISNSIVVPSGDAACFSDQRQTSLVFFGKKYEELSKSTGGGVGSICSNDYSTVLDDFAQVIKEAFDKVELDCVPASAVNVSVVSGKAPSWNLSDKTMNISNIVADAELLIKYQCWVKP